MAEGLNDYFVNIGPALAAEYEEESYNSAQTIKIDFFSHNYSAQKNSLMRVFLDKF